MLKMLNAGRLDAIFGFPVEVVFTAKECGLKIEDLNIFPLSGMELYTPVYIGAPKNGWGKEIINKINKILNKQETIREYSEYYEYWLDSPTRNLYKEYVEGYYSAIFK